MSPTSKIPTATIAGRQIPLTLSAIDRLEKEFGISCMSLADQCQGHFERYQEGEGAEQKTKLRMTGKSVRVGFAAKFLAALLEVKPDDVMTVVPRGKIVHEYAQCMDSFFEVVQQITGADEDESESPTQAGTSTVSGDLKPGLAST